ncbi:MAG: hypothetical protein LBV74_20750 [Tannerella sp.]|jgi:hypothetical protein|nr:hypothetical protein [Tannerella sp.]
MNDIEKHRIIPSSELSNYPFNYKYLMRAFVCEKEENVYPIKAGDLETLQNENSKLDNFYKNISQL